MTGVSSETIHASCVAIGGKAVLIAGPSGSGKSDLALRLIDRGAQLVSDDYTFVRRAGERLVAAAPARIAGKIEVRGIGIVEMDAVTDVPVCLLVDLAGAGERLPSPHLRQMIAGLPLPTVLVSGLEASAPLKVVAALDLLGLDPR